MARDFAAAEIAPHASAWDRDHTFPLPLFSKLGELGLMGICVPEELGGAGADFLAYVLVLEELSRADAGVGVTVAVHTSAVTLPIIAFGTDEQRERFVPGLASGSVLGAFALTEPDSGSDAGALRTSAVADGDGWVLNGSKQWITNGSHASTFLVFARTDAGTHGARGVSAFLLDADQVEVTREEEKLGLHSSSTADITIAGARVAPTGFCTMSMGIHRGDAHPRRRTHRDRRAGRRDRAGGVRRGPSYAVERRQFGKRIADFQAIQFKLADMATEIDAARWLTYRAAWLKQNGHPHTAEGAKAKLHASRTAVHVTQEAIQVLGGYGYTREFPVQRYYRDAKITEIMKARARSSAS